MLIKQFICAILFACFFLTGSATLPSSAQSLAEAQDENNDSVHQNALVAVRRLANREALERQRAAEELARLADAGQLNIVEGYRLQEKNARVRLALDWALYRMGKSEKLFDVVQALDSSRFNQSEAYLAQLETPEPLYKFLDHVGGNTQIKLLETFARVGNADTIEHLKPYTTSFNPSIADAAHFATREITRRLSQPAPNRATRPRQTSSAPSPTSNN